MRTLQEQFTQEQIDYNDGPAMIASCAGVGALSLFVVGLRFWARKIKGVAFGLEDWLMVACVPLLIGTVICAVCAVLLGRVGRHYDVNMVVDYAAYGRSQAALFAVECVYGTLLIVVKFSILAMYWRIFPTKFVRRGCLILGATSLAWLIAVALVAFLQCTPFEKIWLPDTPGQCIDNNKFFIGNAVPNIVVDFCMLTLPTYEVSRLQMRMTQKISLGCIFLLGLFVTVISGVRLVYLFRLSAGGDKTVLITIPWILTVVEGECAVICACLPLLKPVVQLVFGRVLTTRKSSNKLSVPTDTIVTVGGRRSRGKFQDDDSFSRLHDPEALTETTVAVGRGAKGDSKPNAGRANSESSDDIAMDSIQVRQDVSITWTELRTNK